MEVNWYYKWEILHVFTKEERKQFYEESKECNHCKNPVTKSKFHLDHIEALANGGTNHHDNIQVLCISCHADKTKAEKEQGYVKLIDTESSFNTVAKDIFNSSLCSSYAFIDRLVENIDPKIKATKVHHIDINKCR